MLGHGSRPAGRALIVLFVAALGGAATHEVRSLDPERYDIDRFRDYAPGVTMELITDLWSPLRTSDSLTDYYARVNSKWQQPRDTGTTPHQGVDLQAASGTPIFPIHPGWVAFRHGRNSSGVCCVATPGAAPTDQWEIILELDWNNDGVRNDAVFAKYDHIEQVWVTDDEQVFAGHQIGTSGSEAGAYGAHLHFGILNPRLGNTGRWTGMERHYTYVDYWNWGDDLDFISFLKHYADNRVEATSYSLSNGLEEPLDPDGMRVYHRVAGASAWSDSPMQTMAGSTYRWTVDLDALGYAAGTQIQWMLRAWRPRLLEAHPVAYWPPRYAHPGNFPNQTAAAFPYLTATTQSP
jgi:murein DD-endopeptidase MepM/ murein hydrolase activator NlpD